MLEKYHQVRQSAFYIMQKAKHVSIDEKALYDFAKSLSPEKIKKTYIWEAPFHFLGSGQELLNYIFTVDTINFGSGFSPEIQKKTGNSIYAFVASGLKKAMLSGLDLSAKWAEQVTIAELEALFGLEQKELLSQFALCLQETGRFVVQNYKGEYSSLLENLPKEKKGNALISLLTENSKHWDDSGFYQGEKVSFYKRAQILANDLYLGFQGTSFGDFDDIACLTMFADNLVPHVFYCEGVLAYSASLKKQIEKGEFLESYSEPEMEIRASAIVAVEKILNFWTQKQEKGLFPCMLDVYLWNHGHEAHYKKVPRHLTKTFFY